MPDIHGSVGPATLHESTPICPSSRAQSRDCAPSSGRMLGSLHNRGSPARREARACAPQTACDPSTSVGMTEGTAAPPNSTFMSAGGIGFSSQRGGSQTHEQLPGGGELNASGAERRSELTSPRGANQKGKGSQFYRWVRKRL